MSIAFNTSATKYGGEVYPIASTVNTGPRSSMLPITQPDTFYYADRIFDFSWVAEISGLSQREVFFSPLTNTISGNAPLVLLEEYANAGMYQEFSQLAEILQWKNCTPEELLYIIDQALNLELASLAIQLAQQGCQIFPDHKRMQQVGRVLTEPVARRVEIPSSSLAVSQSWLRENAFRYRGQWVAVRDGALIGVATSLETLRFIIGKDVKSLDILVTKVL